MGVTPWRHVPGDKVPCAPDKVLRLPVGPPACLAVDCVGRLGRLHFCGFPSDKRKR